VALTKHERLVLAELEAQLGRARLRAMLSRLRWGRPVVEPALLVLGLAMIVASLAVWWPLAPIGYGLAAFSGVRLGREARHQKLLRSQNSSAEPPR
jgi:hypothetical protein